MKKIKFALVVGIAASLLVSCNVYSPFATRSATEDILDAAFQCLHKSDYDCAIENYNLLTDSELKSQKLCLAYLAKGGVTLTTLTTTLSSGTIALIGNFAQSLVPWTQAKSDALDSAKTHCVAYSASNPSTEPKTKILLKALGLFSHCAIRIAKADLYHGNDPTDTVCTDSGNADGTITDADIGGNGAGAIGGGTNGMCEADAAMCNTDTAALPNATDFGNAELNELATAYTALPNDLKNAATEDDTRVALKLVIQ